MAPIALSPAAPPAVRELLANIREAASKLGADRQARLGRTRLDPADFVALADAGFTRTGVPVAHGGLWTELELSTRVVCEAVRTIAHADPSVALVCAMHPTVLNFWLLADAGGPPQWQAQCERVFASAASGHWWGTIASEPGSGGDLNETKTRARAAEVAGRYLLTGNKHMGSGSGVTSFMLTVARPDGEDAPDVFVLETKDLPWDGSAGVDLVREWDGYGMAATQSHAFRLEEAVAERYARPGGALALAGQAVSGIACVFSAVILGVMQAAVTEAQVRIKGRRLGSFEQTEWVRAKNELWLAEQALEGMLTGLGRAASDLCATQYAVGHGKLAVAELAESSMTRIGRVIGGASFSRSHPFGQWANDVKALGFLRPPWALTFEQLFELEQGER